VSGRAVAALAARDLLLQRSYRLALPFDLFWGLIDLVLYYFISRVVGSPAASLGRAPSYFDFALAGVLGSLVVASATSEIASRIREEELTGTLEAICAQPVRSRDLAFGWAAFPIAYAGARVALYLAVSVAFLHLHTATPSQLVVAVCRWRNATDTAR